MMISVAAQRRCADRDVGSVPRQAGPRVRIFLHRQLMCFGDVCAKAIRAVMGQKAHDTAPHGRIDVQGTGLVERALRVVAPRGRSAVSPGPRCQHSGKSIPVTNRPRRSAR
jgi:hypothetical protein